jgi:biotin transport system substrate-specific component
MQPNAQPLALAVWPETIGRLPAAIIMAIVGTIMLALSARVQVPFYPVPMTLQTFAVMAISAAYGSRLAVATVVLYLAEGLVGLPVFANTAFGSVGPAYFLGTTGGFLIGFIPLAFIVGTAADLGWDRSIPKLFAAMVVGDAIVFALGFAWLAWFATLSPGLIALLKLSPDAHGTGMAFAWINGVANFLLADLLKIALAALAVPASWMLIDRRS